MLLHAVCLSQQCLCIGQETVGNTVSRTLACVTYLGHVRRIKDSVGNSTVILFAQRLLNA